LNYWPKFIELTDSSMLFAFLVRRVLPARPAELAEFQPFGALATVFRRAVVPPLALAARQGHDFAHGAYSRISEIVPAPTVRPPSRIANRAPFSSATGVNSSPVIGVLSPGITISTPSGSWSVPVTSVVRM